jgi:hypothetical protein
LGDAVVLTISTQVARLLGSSEHVRQHNAFVFRFDHRMVERWTSYGDIDEARAAAERLAEERG